MPSFVLLDAEITENDQLHKFKIPFELRDSDESEISGLNSMEAIQYPFFPCVKLDCKYRLNGNGLTPMITLVLLNFLPIPNLPVKIDGNANPSSNSKIKFFSLIYVCPKRTEVPGKTSIDSGITAVLHYLQTN